MEKSNLRHPLVICDLLMNIKIISKSKSGTLASGEIFLNELVEDVKALLQVWEVCRGL